MCAKRSFGMAREWRLRLNIAPVNTPVTLWVCACARVRLSPVCLCGIKRLDTSLCICVRIRACVYGSIPGCSEPCALVLLNPAVTDSLFPATAHHRPRPSYVTVIHTSFNSPTHSHSQYIQFFWLQTTLTARLFLNLLYIPAQTDMFRDTQGICLVMFRLITRVHDCECLPQVLIYTGVWNEFNIREINLWDPWGCME